MNAVAMADRALASLCSCDLDRTLAAGAEPGADPLLACRAVQLADPHLRRDLAAGLRAAVAGAERPRRFSGPSPAAAAAIRGQRARLEELAARLETDADAGIRGIAAVAALLEDSESPLWDGRWALDLVAAINFALTGMEA